jgi:hypothetical protein
MDARSSGQKTRPRAAAVRSRRRRTARHCPRRCAGAHAGDPAHSRDSRSALQVRPQRPSHRHRPPRCAVGIRHLFFIVFVLLLLPLVLREMRPSPADAPSACDPLDCGRALRRPRRIEGPRGGAVAARPTIRRRLLKLLLRRPIAAWISIKVSASSMRVSSAATVWSPPSSSRSRSRFSNTCFQTNRPFRNDSDLKTPSSGHPDFTQACVR